MQVRKTDNFFRETLFYCKLSYLEPCCPWSVTLEASAAVIKKWPQYFGRYNPTGKRYHRSSVYINKHGQYLFVNKKGAWSANDVLNERGFLRGTGRKNDKSGKCVTSVTDWKLWEHDVWRSANITVSCVQGISLYAQKWHCSSKSNSCNQSLYFPPVKSNPRYLIQPSHNIHILSIAWLLLYRTLEI